MGRRRSDGRGGIGGIDVGAMLGLNPWRTPLDVYLDKTGRQTETTINEEAAYWGHALEDLVARRYAEVTDQRVQRVNFTLHIPGTPALANIDRAVINPESGKRVRVLDGAPADHRPHPRMQDRPRAGVQPL